MIPIRRNGAFSGDSERQALDYARALLNILEDSADEQSLYRDTQSAVLNILEDFNEEKSRLEEMKSAVLNILEDLALEKERLEESRAEVVRSEQAIRLSLREKETLLKEVHHRVKNNLQVIASLLRLQSRYLADEQARAIFQESQNRVHSISLVHEMLYQAADLARIELGSYLQTLTSSLAEGWRVGAVRITVDAPGVQVAVDTAIPCGLIVNELVTNALKHAFPDGRSGAIRVRAWREPAGWLNLSVQDDGIGLPANLDMRRSGSLGLELVSTLTRQLRAKFQIHRGGGTGFEFCFPVQDN